MNETLRASFRSVLPLLAVAALFAVGGKEAKAQTAPANATIGNQASASYTDGSGITRTATSNTVITTVLQVRSFTLTANNNKVANPGSPVYYPHTITNTGNGNDSFNLTATNTGPADNFDLSNLAVFADADGNGVPDSTTPITASPTLATGESFRFVVSGVLPTTPTSGQTAATTISATSNTGTTTAQTNVDTVTVTNNAAIEIVKSISVNSGPSPTNGVTYTLAYRNTGNATATGLTITDVVPANETYVPGSGTWSKAAAALTDPAGGDPAGSDGTTINYTATTTVGPPPVTTITAVINSIPAQSSGTVTFKVNINSGVSPSTINNQATFTYNDGAAAQSGNTNTVPFTVTATAVVTLGDFNAGTVQQGAAVKFTDLLTNGGNAIDTFNITLDPIAANNTFPPGTTFKFFKTDGATPLVDTNGDGIVDTGAIGAGANTNVVIIAQLPNGAFSATPVSFNVIATSVKDPSKSDPGVNTANAITQAAVEITNAGGAGAGALTTTPVTTLTGAPGTTQRFTIGVQNLSAIADTYALQFSNTTAFGPAVALPAGFTVTFRNAAGAIVTNTGLLPANSAVVTFSADVFIPANAGQGNVDIYFRAASSTTGASDTKFDRVAVSNVNALAVEPDNFGQVFPGGTITYPHVITNEGNNPLTGISVTLANSAPGFTAVVYADTNGDGILQPSEAATPLPATINLAAGASQNVIVKVFAPAGVDPNTANVTTLTASVVVGGVTITDKATDTTTVVSGDLKIEKLQAVDPDGNGAAPFGAFTKAAGTALPGSYVKYQITVTNTGTVPVSTVVITDATPGYTQFFTAAGAPTLLINGAAGGTIAPAAPADGYAGTFTFTLPVGQQLAPGATMVATFGVRINP